MDVIRSMSGYRLHDYQRRAADAIRGFDRLIVVAEMGAGKTLLTLDALQGCKIFIVAPLRIAQTVWTDEISKWGFGMSVRRVLGTAAQRRRALAVDADVTITNYEQVPWLLDEIGPLAEDVVVVLDECSRVKNPKGRRLRALHKLIAPTKRRYGLTGSPAPQGPLDLWSQVNTIHGPVWGRSFYAWRGQFFRPVDRLGHVWRPNPGAETVISVMFKQRAYKVEYDLDIPATGLTDRVVLPPAILTQYQELEREAVLELQDNTVAAFDPMSQLMKCRQVASGCVYGDEGTSVVHRAKLEALRDIVADSGENVLVAYQFRAEIDLMREVWPDMPVLGGGTSAAEGEEIMRRWNAGEVPVLAGHPASFGHGLNLQGGGRRLVWFSLPWSLEEYEQANARLARQGQNRHVYIHHLVADGTIDRTVLKALSGKGKVQDAIVAALLV